MAKKKSGRCVVGSGQKTKPKAESNPKSPIPNPKSRRAAKRATPAATGNVVLLPIGRVLPNEYNARKQFPKAEIAALAATIDRYGLVHPIVVREAPDQPDKFEVVSGERRRRACVTLNWKTIPAVVRALGDEEAHEIYVIENLQRKDLDPIEQARDLALLVSDGRTQQQVADRLKCSQSHVANRIRLLTLPAVWQAMVISGEIPMAHARELICYAKHSALHETITTDIRDMLKEQAIGSPATFADHIRWGFATCCRRLGLKKYDRTWNHRLGGYETQFKPTEEQLDKLAVIAIDRDGQTDRLATNVKLFDELQKAHVAALIARKEGKGGKGKGESGKKQGEQPKELTAADKKAAYVEAAAKKKAAARKFRGRLDGWRVDWLRYLIAEHLRGGAAADDACRVLMLATALWSQGYECREALRLLLRMAGAKSPNLVAAMAGLGDHLVRRVAGQLAASMFFDSNGQQPMAVVPDRDVEQLAAMLQVDVEAAWLADQAGPLSEPYWQLHNIEQLGELAKELGVAPPSQMAKAAMVSELLAKRPKPDDKEIGLNMPKELKRRKKGK